MTGAGRAQEPASSGDAPRAASEIASYHAHVYFDAATRGRAALLRDWIDQRFVARLGRWHEQPVGPHPAPMYQVAFRIGLFAEFVPWLMLNRQGLTILVHPNTQNPRADHLDHALWLGAVLPLDGSILPEQTDAGDTAMELGPNTRAASGDRRG